MKTKNKVLTICGSALIAVCLGGCVALDALSARYSTVITRWWSGTFSTATTDKGDTQLKAADAAADLTETVEEEGAVLLKNKNNVLPMKVSASTKNIALLGYASYSPTYVGVGSVSQSGSYLSNDFIDFYDAFETAGFKCNKNMKEYYKKYGVNTSASGSMDGSGWTQANGISDGPIEGTSEACVAYKSALEAAKTYSTTAVLVFSRVGAEGGDCALDMTGKANSD